MISHLQGFMKSYNDTAAAKRPPRGRSQCVKLREQFFPRLEKAKTGPVQGGVGIGIPNYIFPQAWHLRGVMFFSIICRIEMIHYIIYFNKNLLNKRNVK
jgi:hypothetical protein